MIVNILDRWDAAERELGMNPDAGLELFQQFPRVGDLLEAVRTEATRPAVPVQDALRKAAEYALTFLGTIEWNDAASEDGAGDVRNELEAALSSHPPAVQDALTTLAEKWRADADRAAQTVADTGLWGGIALGLRNAADELEAALRRKAGGE